MLGRILVFLGGLVVLLLFAALFAPLFVDWTGFRQEFEDQASRIIGKKVTVQGSVDARLLPFPSVTLNDVQVGREPDGSPQIRVARFSMDAELAPILSGEAMIFDMRIEDMTARIRLLKDGTLDWMRGSNPEIPARTVVLENVRIRNGSVTFIDEQSGRTRKLTNLNAAMSAKSLAGPWKAVGDAVLDGEAGRFSLSTTLNEDRKEGLWLKARVTPNKRPFGAEMEGALTVTDGKPLYKGNFLAFLQLGENAADEQDGQPAPRLKGGFELTNERLRIPEFRLEVGDMQDPYVVTGEATLDTGSKPEFLLLADGQQIDVSRIDYSGASGRTGRDPGDTLRKRLERFSEIAASIPVPTVPGRASLKLPAIVIGDTSIRDVQVDVRPAAGGWLVDHAVATLPGRTQLEANGVLGLKGGASFNGHLLMASRQPTGLSSWLSGEVDPAIRDLKTLGFEADVRLSPDLQRFQNLEMQLGEANLKGSIERQSVDGQQPALTAILNGNRIDLDVLRGLSTLFGKDGRADLSGHAIAAELKAGVFAAFGMEAQQTETVFTIANGALSIEKFNTRDLAGAQLTAIGRADFSKEKLDANGRIGFKAADPTAFLEMIAAKLPSDPLLGHLLAHAGWFANTELKVTLAAGGKDRTGLSVKLAGTSNGSRVDLDLGLADPAAYPGGAGLNLQATLENPDSNILLGQAGLEPLPLEGADKGVLSLRLAGGKDASNDLEIAFNSGNTNVNLKGKAELFGVEKATGSFHLTANSDDAEPYLAMNGISLPQLGLGLPLTLDMGITVTPEVITLSEINGAVAGNALSGALELKRGAPGLTGTGSLALTSLDLGWLAEAVYGPVIAQDGGLSTTDFSNGMLAGTGLSLDLTAKTFWTDFTAPVRDFKAKLTTSDGELQLGDASGNWAGGAFTGALRMGNSAGNGYLQASADVSDANVSAISWYRGDQPLANGQFTLKLSGEAAGKSVKDLVASLGGSGEMRLNGLSIHGLNLDILNGLITTLDVTGGEISTATVNPLLETLMQDGETALGDVTVPFSLGGGKVDIQPVSVTTPQATLTAEGEADLTEGRMRSSVTFALQPGANAVEGADPSLRLDFAGLIKDPGRSVDTLGLTNFLSLRAFEKERRRVDRLQTIAQERLRLRREAAYFKARAEERERLRQEAEAARIRAEAEAAQKALEEQQKQQEQLQMAPQAEPQSPDGTMVPEHLLPVLPQDQVIKGAPLPPPSSP